MFVVLLLFLVWLYLINMRDLRLESVGDIFKLELACHIYTSDGSTNAFFVVDCIRDEER